MKKQLCGIYGPVLAGILAFALVPGMRAASGNNNTNAGYTEMDIVSDGANSNATHIDPNLVNAWGIVASTKSIWVNNNGTGLLTTYSAVGKPMKPVINVPSPGSPTGGAPSGLVMNNTSGFQVSNGKKTAPATFLLATEDGTIVGWNDILGSNAVIVVDNSSSNTVPVPSGNASTHAIYKGLAIVNDETGVPHLYAANFSGGVIDEFDTNFVYMGSFTDPTLQPDTFAPFNVRNIRGRLFVTFAKQLLPEAMDDEAGAGNGMVEIFDTDGTLLRRVVSVGQLNSPWGMVVAPENFGKFSKALLVGNFGDGHINAYDLLTGKWLGNFTDANGDDLIIPGLWGLTFEKEEVPGNECSFNAQRLYFTAGPNGENDGLLGILRPVNPSFPQAN